MSTLRTRTLCLVGLLCILTMLATSSTLAAPVSQEHSKPLVIINTPFSNSTYESGETVQVESTSSDSAGIVKVELFVDDVLAATDATPNNAPQVEYKLIQRWQAEAGTHTLTVRATNAEQVSGEAAITVVVAGNSPAGLTPVPTTATPAAAECLLSSKFIKDVTVPDGTRVAPGSAFVKMWDVQNDGTCTWDSTFSVMFVGGVRMGAATPAPIPATAPGTISRITLNFIAPTTPGAYTSVWSISGPNADSFGQSFWVKIVVPGAPTPIAPPPPPPPPQQPTRVPPPPSGCQGVPSLGVGPYGGLQFGADSYQLNQGQKTRIYWGPVMNADHAVLSNSVAGDSPIGTPGQETVRPQQTTQFTLRAWCKGRGYVLASFAIQVNSKPPPQPEGSLQITEVKPRGGTASNVSVNYTWNGVGAPAAIEITGYNGKNEPVTDKVTTAIQRPGGSIKRSIAARLGVGKMTHVDACMLIHKDQQTFQCARHNVK